MPGVPEKNKNRESFMLHDFTRRGLLASAGALAVASRVRAAEPVFDTSRPTQGVVIPAEKTGGDECRTDHSQKGQQTVE